MTKPLYCLAFVIGAASSLVGVVVILAQDCLRWLGKEMHILYVTVYRSVTKLCCALRADSSFQRYLNEGPEFRVSVGPSAFCSNPCDGLTSPHSFYIATTRLWLS